MTVGELDSFRHILHTQIKDTEKPVIQRGKIYIFFKAEENKLFVEEA